jgi:hypothetical protein
MGGVFSVRAQTVTQSITLQNGWNAVYLNVAPTNTAPAAVFGKLPVQSVWTRAEPISTAQFIQDPDEAAFNVAEWVRWVPAEPAFISTLHAVQGYRAYLVKLTNGPVNWQVTGTPAAQELRWASDLYNLRSFPVDPTAPPTFKAFLASSSALYDVAQDRPRGVFRLGSAGKWVEANKSEPLEAGIAYWVYCQGASDFAAPLKLSLDSGNVLNFGQELGRTTLQFENLGPGVRTVTLRQSAGFLAGVLAFQRFNSTNGFEWTDLPNPFTLQVTNGTARNLVLAVRRNRMPLKNYASILEVTDGQGTKLSLPVTVEKTGAGYAGLWIGNVTINAVGEPHYGSVVTNLYALVGSQSIPLTDPNLVITTNQVVGADGNTKEQLAATSNGETVPIYEKVERRQTEQSPTPTKSEFGMRLILHVDASGQARLLKEVVQMWRDGTYTNNPQGMQVLDKPGTYVLLTRDALLSEFKGCVLRDGTMVGRRIGSIGFDFDSQGTNHMELTGAFAPGQTLAGQIRLAPDYPLNPFRHKYHPDHDNLNSEFAPITNTATAESYKIVRDLHFKFSSTTSASGTEADPGYSTMEGVYLETLTGLHKQPLKVQGKFFLSRASYIAELNPNPVP